MKPIEYKTIKKVWPTDKPDTYTVDVELTDKPSQDWIEEFLDAVRRDTFCPAVRVEEDVVTFETSDAQLKRSLERLRKAISRTNLDQKPKKRSLVKDLDSKKAADRQAAAKERFRQLQEEGF